VPLSSRSPVFCISLTTSITWVGHQYYLLGLHTPLCIGSFSIYYAPKKVDLEVAENFFCQKRKFEGSMFNLLKIQISKTSLNRNEYYKVPIEFNLRDKQTSDQLSNCEIGNFMLCCFLPLFQ
jgi:hypothetical protein